jgi:hypothetical protein
VRDFRHKEFAVVGMANDLKPCVIHGKNWKIKKLKDWKIAKRRF